ncbi:MAG: putative holin [Providencia heimbachae]|nr:putative holin [Providencia heimbachae]
MPHTASATIAATVGGGVVGGILGGADYGIVTGAVIGATVAVIASRENNLQKVLLFFLSFLTGALTTEKVDYLIHEQTGWNLGGTLTAILVSSLFISLLMIIASSDSLRKALRWLPSLVERNFAKIIDTFSEIWRSKK